MEMDSSPRGHTQQPHTQRTIGPRRSTLAALTPLRHTLKTMFVCQLSQGMVLAYSLVKARMQTGR
jgi:hypothetical protein